MTNQRSLSERPTKLSDFVASDNIKNQIKALVKDKVRALLICGETGCGKTTLAEIIANALSGNTTSDISRLNFVSENGIDTVRSLIDKISYLPSNKRRVIILEEFHGATKQAQDAFLDAIDHPPHDKITFIFTTNQDHKLQKTLKDRCSKIRLPMPTLEILVSYLTDLGFKPKIAKQAASDSGNSFRAALQNAQDLTSGGSSEKEKEDKKYPYADKVRAWKDLVKTPNEKTLKAFINTCENDFMAIRTFTMLCNDHLAYRLGNNINPYVVGLFDKISPDDVPFEKLARLAKASTQAYDESKNGEVFTNRFVSIFVGHLK